VHYFVQLVHFEPVEHFVLVHYFVHLVHFEPVEHFVLVHYFVQLVHYFEPELDLVALVAEGVLVGWDSF
jgi:hypothetical protein